MRIVRSMVSQGVAWAFVLLLSVGVGAGCEGNGDGGGSAADTVGGGDTGPGGDDTAEPAPQTIVDIAAADDRFETLVAAVTAAGLADDLAGPGPFTVFAPTDEAFAALPAGTVEGLLADVPALTEVLLYHVIAGELRAADVVMETTLTTLQGQAVPIRVEGDAVFVGDAQVILTDILAANGVIHVIDAVLLPPAQ